MSVGIASFPIDADSRDGLIIATDQALSFAKEGGRNRVCRYSETLKSVIEKDQDKLAEILLDPKMTQQQAIEELRRNAGSQFDPRVVETFVKLLKALP